VNKHILGPQGNNPLQTISRLEEKTASLPRHDILEGKGKGKVYACTGTEALCRPNGP